MNLNQVHIAYFVGIGGIGMSAIARYFALRGIEVHGYDRVRTKLTENLESEGMKIHYSEDVSQIPTKVDIVIYTPAVPLDHQELVALKEAGHKLWKRAEILGLISKERKTIAIAGTHGKTTTSSILTHLLRNGGIDVTAFLGGISLDLHSNFVFGASEWMVVEADEFDRSFHQLHPDIAVVMSIDPDHLDIYGSLDQMKESYQEFVNKLYNKGILITKEGIRLSPEASSVTHETFGYENAVYRIENIRVDNRKFVFDLVAPGNTVRNLRFGLPGNHNLENACAAIIVAMHLGVETEKIREGIESFSGIKRRFEFKINEEELILIDDYAHHPEELKAAITAGKTLFPDKMITGVFQPHLFSRTQDFASGFAEALDLLDEPILMDIYPARELPIAGVDSGVIFSKMKNPKKIWVKDEDLLPVIADKKIEVLMTLGAGNIDKKIEPLKGLLLNKKS